MDTAVDWFGRMRIELEAARGHWNATRARLAPDFNAIRFLRNDEHGLSTILASLLDPKGDHGQGRLFLARFIERHWSGTTLDCDGAQVRLESPTSAQRRIDIVVRFGDGAVLGIESKLCGASDSHRQVADYLNHLAELASGPHRLFYVTPQADRRPAKSSIPLEAMQQAIADGRLLCLSANDLAEWLGDCIGACRAERVRAFLGDLIDYLTTDLQGITNMNEHDLIVAAATRDVDSARAALQIATAQGAIRTSLLKHFAETLKQRIAAGDLALPADWIVVVDPDLQVQYASISLRPKEQASHRIRLGFEKGGAKDAGIGVSKIDEGASNLNHPMAEVCVALAGAFGPERQSDWWPWYRYFEPRNWDHVDVMARLRDDSDKGMVAYTLRAFAEILDVLKQHDLLSKFSAAAPAFEEASRPGIDTTHPQEQTIVA